MRDCSKNRAGFDRVLMAVAATFLAVSATSALAQTDTDPHQRRGTRDRCGDPASRTCERPAADHQRFQAGHDGVVPTQPGATASRKATATAGQQDGYDVAQRPPNRSRHRNQSKPAEITARRSRNQPNDTGNDTRPPRPAAGNRQRRLPSPPRSRSRLRATCRRPTSRSPTSCATCSAQSRCAISTARPNAPRSRNSTPRANMRRCGPQGGKLDRQRQGRHRAPQGCRLRWPQSRRLSGAGFCRRDLAGPACGSRIEADRQHAGLCAPGAERPDALVAGQRRHPLSRASDRSGRGAGQCHDRQGCLRGA